MSQRQALPLMIVLALLMFAPPVQAAPDEPQTLTALADLTSFQQTECVDCPPAVYGLGDGSMRLDSLGHPHVAFVLDYVYYAHYDGAAWHTEIVAPAPAPVYDWYRAPASIALDATDTPHIAYLSPDNTKLLYARKTASGWDVQTVDAGAGPPQSINYETTLALDSQGLPHLAYSVYGKLKYARLGPSGWQIQTIDNNGWTELYISLALDAHDTPHIAYFNVDSVSLERTSRLRYATLENDSWEVEKIDQGAPWLGEFCSLALDGQGRVHVSYLDASREQLKYARRGSGGGWAIEGIGPAHWWGGFTSIAIDRSDRPHVSYVDGIAVLPLHYAVRTESGWNVSTTENQVWFTSMQLDATDTPHIIYQSLSGHVLQYAHLTGGVWAKSPVDLLPDVGLYASIAADAQAEPRISYQDRARGDLRYAAHGATGWTLEVVDTEDTVGAYTGLALDATGVPHISYYDATHGDLKYAERNGAGWLITAVDTAGDVGQHTATALDAAGEPTIAYYDVTNGALKLARRQGGTWTREVVDASGDVGQYASLALNGSGRAHIGYYDATNHDLKYAHEGDAGWIIEKVDTAGDVGQYASLALDAAGKPQIAYYDATHKDLKYAAWNGSAWRIETVDSENDVGKDTSIALEVDGTPHIGYHAADTAAAIPIGVKYAQRGAGGWETGYMMKGWQQGSNATLAIANNGRIFIAYYDGDNHYLRMLAGYSKGQWLPLVVR